MKMGVAVIAELQRLGELVEVVVNEPGATASGTCALCESMEGEPVDEVGYPPYHKHCACKTRMVQIERQPADILEEEFEGINPPEPEPEDPGGVFELDEEPLEV